MQLFHGGSLDSPQSRMWLSASRDYSACFAQLYDEEFVWAVTVELRETEILDVSSCGLDVTAMATLLRDKGLSVEVQPEDKTHHLLWRIPNEQIRQAGYRAVRLMETADWGNGPLTAVSLCLVDIDAIVQRSMLSIS